MTPEASAAASPWSETFRGGAMIEQFVNFVIRPPRAEYNPDQYLWEPEFTLAGRKYKRIDLELSNERNQILKSGTGTYMCNSFCQDIMGARCLEKFRRDL